MSHRHDAVGPPVACWNRFVAVENYTTSLTPCCRQANNHLADKSGFSGSCSSRTRAWQLAVRPDALVFPAPFPRWQTCNGQATPRSRGLVKAVGPRYLIRQVLDT